MHKLGTEACLIPGFTDEEYNIGKDEGYSVKQGNR